MTKWESRHGLDDRPDTHTPPRSAGGAVADPDAPPAAPVGSNPQSQTPGWTEDRRRRWHWLRSNIADQAGSGVLPERADFDALPAAHRDRARAIAREAVKLHESGEQAAALTRARGGMAVLEREIGHRWSPPAPEPPDSKLLDEIQGVIP